MVFDFNGVIVDDEPIHQRAFAAVLADQGIRLTEQAYFGNYLGLDDRACLIQVWKDLCDRPLPNEATLLQLVEDKADAYLARIAAGAPLCPGVADLVRALAEELPVAICSGARRREIEAVLAQVRLADCFRILVTADEVPQGKPHPSGYRRAITALGVDPHHGLALEDAPRGIAAAHGAGLVCVGVVGSATAEQLGATADGVFENLLGVRPGDLGRIWKTARA